MFSHNSKDDVEKLKKKLEEFEKKIDSNFNSLQKEFIETRNLMLKMREERKKLLRDKARIESDLAQIMDKLGHDRFKEKKNRSVLEMMKEELQEDVDLIKRIVHEDMHIEHENKEEGEVVLKKPVVRKAEKARDEIEYMHSIAKAATVDNVSTPLDKLYEYVSSHGKVKINEAAAQFDVTEEQIEDWARILEARDLVELYYPTFGKTEIRKK